MVKYQGWKIKIELLFGQTRLFDSMRFSSSCAHGSFPLLFFTLTSACQHPIYLAKHSQNALSSGRPLLIPQSQVNAPSFEVSKESRAFILTHLDVCVCVCVLALYYNHAQANDS